MWSCPSEGKDSAPPTRAQAPVLPNRKPTETPGPTSLTRGQTVEARRNTILQPVEQKPHSQKDRNMKRQKAIYQMKEQEKNPEKQLNEVEIGHLPEKEFRIMIMKMIQDLGKRMEAKIEKMQEMFNKDL